GGGVAVDDPQPTRDIDRVIAAVKARLPEVVVWQMHKRHPGDDDGIWWFALPDIDRDIQLESSFGTCPFLVETAEQSSYDARHAPSVDEAVELVVGYLEPLPGGPGAGGPG